MFNGLDHIAIAVSDTQQALSIWRDQLGFPLLYSQVVNEGTVRLTHLDLGNAQLQLVEPLTREHPLWRLARGARRGTASHLPACRRCDGVRRRVVVARTDIRQATARGHAG